MGNQKFIIEIHGIVNFEGERWDVELQIPILSSKLNQISIDR